MLNRVALESAALDATVRPEAGWAIGHSHFGLPKREREAGHEASLHVFLHGDLDNEPDLRAEVERHSGRLAPGPAAVVEALYRQVGVAALQRLEGSYALAVLDERRRELLLSTDLLGSYPLYWFHDRCQLIFSSKLAAVLRSPRAPRVLSARALADYLELGFVLGDKTLADGVQLVPPGSTLTYSYESGTVRLERHRWIAEAFGDVSIARNDYLTDVGESFNRSVHLALRGTHRYGLSLSGGLDSRTILSALNGDAGSIGTYTLGVRGCADQVIADRLAAVAGTSHRFFELDDRYLGQFLPKLREMVCLTDGMYLSHGLTEMLALGFMRQMGYTVLLRGHAGEVAKSSLAWPLHTDDAVKKMNGAGELIPYLLARVNYLSPSLTLKELLTPEWYSAIEGGARQSLEESLDGVPLSPRDLCSYLYLTEHHRRCTIASLEIFRDALDVRMPFANERFLRSLLAGSPAWREGTDIHTDIIRRNNRRLLKVRNSNTGAPAGAGPLTEAILDRFNSLFKRLNVYGYRHYHAFDAWMKRTLVDSVESVLLEPAAVARGIFRPDTIRRLIAETRNGAADHAYPFQVMLIVELWQRENL